MVSAKRHRERRSYGGGGGGGGLAGRVGAVWCGTRTHTSAFARACARAAAHTAAAARRCNACNTSNRSCNRRNRCNRCNRIMRSNTTAAARSHGQHARAFPAKKPVVDRDGGAVSLRNRSHRNGAYSRRA